MVRSPDGTPESEGGAAGGGIALAEVGGCGSAGDGSEAATGAAPEELSLGVVFTLTAGAGKPAGADAALETSFERGRGVVGSANDAPPEGDSADDDVRAASAALAVAPGRATLTVA
jgi:hypothetical protein